MLTIMPSILLSHAIGMMPFLPVTESMRPIGSQIKYAKMVESNVI